MQLVSVLTRTLSYGARVAALTFVTSGALRAQVPAAPPTELRGVVVDSSGQAVPGAQIEVVGTSLQAVTGDSGTFRIERLPANARALRVRRLGFQPVVVNLPTILGPQHDVRIRLTGTIAMLEPVRVEGQYGKPARYAGTMRFDEFYRRRSLGTGRFLTREEIEAMTARDALDLLRIAPGVRVQRQPLGEAILKFPRCGQTTVGTQSGRQGMTRATPPGGNPLAAAATTQGLGQGRILLFVDGLQQDINTLPEYLATDVEAIEVYRSAVELPVEARGNGCAAIFIWTRFGG